MAKRVRKTKTAGQADAIASLLGGGPKAPAAAQAASMRRHFTPDEHIAWVQANCCRDEKGRGWVPLVYGPWQARSIRKLWAVDAAGQLVFRTIAPCFPRRCGKSEVTGMYDLHRASEYDDQVIVIQANSEDQGSDTVFKTIVDCIRNSPALRKRERTTDNPDGDIVITAGDISFANGSIIKVQPCKEASTYGQRISVYHNTEMCKAVSDAVYQVGASSTGDAWCGLAIVDSNMGSVDNAVYRYVQLALDAEQEAASAAVESRPQNPDVGDPSIGAVWIHFADIDDVLRRGCGIGLDDPSQVIHPWLDAAWIRGRFKQMTRGEFLRNHCNLPSGAGDTLWSAEQIDPLFVPLPAVMGPDDLRQWILRQGGDGSYAIGVGLDRASAFSKDPDRSVVTAVAKYFLPKMYKQLVPVYDDHGRVIEHTECDGTFYLWVGAWEYRFALRDPIAAKLDQIADAWGIGGCNLESHQASDLGEWCGKQWWGGKVHVCSMTAQAKTQLVEQAHGLVVTRRLTIPAHYYVLHAEWTNYSEDASGSVPSYEGRRKTVDLADESGNRVSTWIKDDYLESGLWAIDAAREASLSGRMRIVDKPAGW